MEIEGGLAYLEMLNNGVSEKTARAIATDVGMVNAGLEAAQLDELVKAYKVLGKIGADDSFLKIVIRELANRGIDVAKETAQEVLQEGVTTAGAQLGSKLDTGDWAYNSREVLNRLWNTATESSLTFGLTNGLSAVHNIGTQNQSRMTQLAAQGEARLRAGEMPTSEQLRAMNMSEPEARGRMVMLNLDKFDDSDTSRTGERTNQLFEDNQIDIPESAKDIAKQVQGNNGTPLKGYKGGRTYKNAPADNGAQKLPEGVNYKEYDIYPYIKGQNRGTARIVIGDDGSVWYTNDHYRTFTKIE